MEQLFGQNQAFGVAPPSLSEILLRGVAPIIFRGGIPYRSTGGAIGAGLLRAGQGIGGVLGEEMGQRRRDPMMRAMGVIDPAIQAVQAAMGPGGMPISTTLEQPPDIGQQGPPSPGTFAQPPFAQPQGPRVPSPVVPTAPELMAKMTPEQRTPFLMAHMMGLGGLVTPEPPKYQAIGRGGARESRTGEIIPPIEPIQSPLQKLQLKEKQQSDQAATLLRTDFEQAVRANPKAKSGQIAAELLYGPNAAKYTGLAANDRIQALANQYSHDQEQEVNRRDRKQLELAQRAADAQQRRTERLEDKEEDRQRKRQTSLAVMTDALDRMDVLIEEMDKKGFLPKTTNQISIKTAAAQRWWNNADTTYQTWKQLQPTAIGFDRGVLNDIGPRAIRAFEATLGFFDNPPTKEASHEIVNQMRGLLETSRSPSARTGEAPTTIPSTKGLNPEAQKLLEEYQKRFPR